MKCNDMKLLIATIFFVILGGNNIYTQDLYKAGVKITNIKIVEGKPRNFRYTIHNDTCIDTKRVFFVKEEMYSGSWGWINLALASIAVKGVEYDSVLNKIYLYPNLRMNSYRRELYDFNLSVDSVNKYGFKVDSIRNILLMGKSRKLFFLSGSASWLPSGRKYDIWIEGFGSIALDILDPTQHFQVDGETYNYDTLINFGNHWKRTQREYTLPKLIVTTITDIEDKTLPKYSISYHCDSTSDTTGVYDKCVDNPLYSFKVSVSIDSLKSYKCLDTLNYVLTVLPFDSSRITIWKSNPTVVINYPDTVGSIDYMTSVLVMNSDSSCKSVIFTPKLKVKCDYCDNPTHHPELNISLLKDTIVCNDSIIANVISKGALDSLWFIQTSFLNRKFKGYQSIQFMFGNRYCVRDSVSKSIFYNCETNGQMNLIFSPSISIYPNPSNEFIFIEKSLTDNNREYNYELYNLLGERISTYSFNKSLERINVSYLSNGIYLLKLTSKDESFQSQHRIVIQH